MRFRKAGYKKKQAYSKRDRYAKDITFRLRCIKDAAVRSLKRKAALKAFVDEIKSLTACADCVQFFNPECMDFDHLPGHKKSKDVAQFISGRGSFARLKKEIAKCELVCACCHRTRTKKRALTRATKDAIILKVT